MAGSFTLDVTRWAAQAQDRLDLVVRKISLELFIPMVMKTPVDTGRARGNWKCEIDQVDLVETGEIDRGGGKTIERISTVLDGAKAGTIIYLTNTLPYIVALEQGSSRQAPAGMLATTLREFPGVVERAGREVARS